MRCARRVRRFFVGFDFQQSVGARQRRRIEIAASKGKPLHHSAECPPDRPEPFAAGVELARKIKPKSLRHRRERNAPLGDDRQRTEWIESAIAGRTFLVSGMNVDVHFDIAGSRAQTGTAGPCSIARPARSCAASIPLTALPRASPHLWPSSSPIIRSFSSQRRNSSAQSATACCAAPRSYRWIAGNT